MRVLVVEDEKKTAAFIRKACRAQRIDVAVACDGPQALQEATFNAYDAIILDIMLPGGDGLSVLKELRRRANTTPVLLLSARGQLEDRVEGLYLGADDYLAKPFAVAELLARIRALVRRGSPEAKASALKVGDLSLDTVTREVRYGENRLELTSREFRLLEYLMRSSPRICTRTAILEQVWDYHFDPGSNIVEACIRRLRAKLAPKDEPDTLLQTVRGAGYLLAVKP